MRLKTINRLAISLAVFFAIKAAAQSGNYFQQALSYTIQVGLNDTQNSLQATETILYTNNSDKVLDTIYMHVWPNAYKNNSSALAKQLVTSGDTKFQFANDNERGFIDSLDFSVDNIKVRWAYNPQQQDICYLVLNNGLQPGQTITISTPFYVKLPDAKFSRLGHTGQAYFITQWYPKPAVFDNKGWHIMPYLNQGEFYGEYASFDVFITLPQNYLLAATGDRIDADDENVFLEKKIAETRSHIQNGTRYKFGMAFPPSSSSLKTVHFRQHRVHDFAWFADKRFYVLRDQVELPETKRLVDTWVFFTDKNFSYWQDAISYVNDATVFYSFHLGDYPYNHVTAVDGTIMAGGGMEYPNITVINDPGSALELDMVITHEVGHNWFYGVLGNNEREHPFLDEGLNSFYELRYLRAKYGDSRFSALFGRDSLKLFRLNQLPLWKYHELSFFSALHNNTDQPLYLSSEKFTESNYGAVVYSKSAVVLDYLMSVVGEERFDMAMSEYYKTYRFKHPYPEDFFASLSASLQEDLSWFTNVFYFSRQRVDYKLKRVRQFNDGSWGIVIKNKQKAEVPFFVQGFRNGKIVVDVFSSGKGKKIKLGVPPVDADYFAIDADQRLPELRRNNNTQKTRGLFKKTEPLQFSFLTAIDNGSHTQVNWLPLAGVNAYNGLLLGLGLHNIGFFSKPVELVLAPMYGFKDKTVNGYASLQYNWKPNEKIRLASFSATVKKYAYDSYLFSDGIQRNLSFTKFSPAVQVELNPKVKQPNKNQTINYTANLLFTDSVHFSRANSSASLVLSRFSWINTFRYELINQRAIDPYQAEFAIQHTGSMAKTFATFEYNFTFSEKRKLTLRLFAGTFLAGSTDEKAYYAFRASGLNGNQDYLFTGNFYNRQATRNSLAGAQFLNTDGAMAVYSPLGQANRWLLALNLKSPNVFKSIPLRVFADVVTCNPEALGSENVLWDFGLEFTLVKNIVECYLPLLYSNSISNVLTLNGVQKINTFRFTFNIHKFDAKKTVQTGIL